jgi:hypothetical protein
MIAKSVEIRPEKKRRAHEHLLGSAARFFAKRSSRRATISSSVWDWNRQSGKPELNTTQTGSLL